MLNLSKDSTFLFNYYDELLKKSDKNLLFIPDNKKSSLYIDFQKHIYDILDNIYDILGKDLHTIHNLRTVYDYNTREYKRLIRNVYNKHFSNNPYIDNKIKEYIKNKPGSLITYQLPFKDKTITINLIKYSKISPKQLKNFDNLVKNMMAQIYLINHLTKNNTCSEDSLNVYLFLTPFKRELEKSQEKVLGASNANGGFCYGCVSNGDIVVYRQEEVFKVFSHELVHNFGVDGYIWQFMTQVKVKNTKEYLIYNKFLDYFNLGRENNIGIQESLVEFWGEFFNNAIYSFVYSKSCNLSTYKQEFKFYTQVFETVMKFEIIHSFLQTTKIISHNRLNYIDILSTNNNKPVYKENTHIFSYYILKLYILFGYKEFINSQISLTRENRLFFNNSLQNMQKFFNYMSSVSKNSYFLQNIKFMRELYTSIRVLKTKNLNFLLNNLRMSVLEYH
jgi:hypothetical protein